MPREGSKTGDYGRARVLIMRGRQREALKELKRILRRNPQDADALFQLGRLKLEMGKAEGARRFFGRCARVDRNGKWSREIISHLRRLE